MFRVLLNWTALFVQLQLNTTRFLLTPSGIAESKGIFFKTFILAGTDTFEKDKEAFLTYDTNIVLLILSSCDLGPFLCLGNKRCCMLFADNHLLCTCCNS